MFRLPVPRRLPCAPLMRSIQGLASVQARGEAELANLLSLRSEKCQVGQEFVSTQDAGVRGTVFHTWEGGAWVRLAPGAAELPLEEHQFEIAGTDSCTQVPRAAGGQVLSYDGAVLFGAEEEDTVPMTLTAAELGPNDRARIESPLHTGVGAVDLLAPVGRGQSMLLHGPRGSGKSTVLMQAIAAQRGTAVQCVLVLYGCTEESLLQTLAELRSRDALKHTTVVCDLDQQLARSPVGPFLASLTATALAERTRALGGHSLLLHDEFQVHYSAYRGIFASLEGGMDAKAAQSTHRQLYAGLLQRSAELTGGGSVSTLLAIESPPLQPDEFMSISDGQICLSQQLLQEGHRPALDPTKSLSRIGARARSPALHQVGNGLRMQISQHLDDLKFGGAGDPQMARVLQALQQSGQEVWGVEQLALGVMGCLSPALVAVHPSHVLDRNHGLVPFAARRSPELLARLAEGTALEPAEHQELEGLCAEYAAAWGERELIRAPKKKKKKKSKP